MVYLNEFRWRAHHQCVEFKFAHTRYVCEQKELSTWSELAFELAKSLQNVRRQKELSALEMFGFLFSFHISHDRRTEEKNKNQKHISCTEYKNRNNNNGIGSTPTMVNNRLFRAYIRFWKIVYFIICWLKMHVKSYIMNARINVKEHENNRKLNTSIGESKISNKNRNWNDEENWSKCLHTKRNQTEKITRMKE